MVRAIAFYLPQYMPTKENDKWWGKGFTEWTNVGRAKPLFNGHYQPKVPTELGYYDLRIPEVREQQAKLAKESGIEGFCYWHYWFNGKRLLDKVFEEVVDNKTPDFPFCLCWANHSWYKKTWDSTKPNIMLVEQTYPGVEDYINHFNSLIKAFRDDRYIKVDGKPVFGVFAPHDIPDVKLFISTWNNLAKKNGLSGFYFWGFTYEETLVQKIKSQGFDAVVFDYMLSSFRKSEKMYTKKLKRKIRELFGLPTLFSYKAYSNLLVRNFYNEEDVKPCIIPNFDHSPRSGIKNIIINDTTPELWGGLCQNVLNKIKKRKEDENFLFIKAWNEWGEGNYLEPDLKYGRAYLEQLRKALKVGAK